MKSLEDSLETARKVYGRKYKDEIKRAFYEYPEFRELNHGEAFSDAVEFYGADKEDKVREAFLRFPPFATYNQEEVFNRIKKAHGFKDDEAVKRAILKNPQFANEYCLEEDPSKQSFEENESDEAGVYLRNSVETDGLIANLE